MRIQSGYLKRRGFALIAIISLLILLTVMAVALLSLSANSVKTARSDWAAEEARSNARLALMVAIGELQRDLGPDQRVSANAEILDNVDHPHWVGVWKTNDESFHSGDNETPWSRNDDLGGLSDSRNLGTYDREGAVVNYLVSGNEGGKERGMSFSARSQEIQSEHPDSVTLVGSGSVVDSRDEVHVPRVGTRRVRRLADGSRASRPTGSLGYWVSDLGVKAHVGAVDRHRDTQVVRSTGEGMQRVTQAQNTEVELITDFPEISPDQLENVHSVETLVVADSGSRDSVSSLFHDLTAYGLALFTNVRDGGTQRDLTAFLHLNEKGGEISPLETERGILPGISDADLMAGPPNSETAALRGESWENARYREVAPTFGLLRNWAEKAESTPYMEEELNQDSGETRNLVGTAGGSNVYDGLNSRATSFLPHRETNMNPVIVEAVTYYNLASRRIGETWKLRLCLYPRVTLWNPYNTEMRLSPTMVQMFLNGHKDVRLTIPGRSPERLELGYGDPAGHLKGLTFWRLPSMTIAPGQTVVFSSNSARRYNPNSLSQNRLSAEISPNPSRYYYTDYDQEFEGQPTLFVESPDFSDAKNKSGADNYMAALKVITSGGTITKAKFSQFPLLAYVNTALQAGGSDEIPVAWNELDPVPIYSLNSSTPRIPETAKPDVRTRDGFRLRWWKEHESNLQASGALSNHRRHFQTAAIANWNLRGAYSCRNPFDNVTDVAPFFFGLYTKDLFDEAVSWDQMMPVSAGGINLGHPFGQPLGGPQAIVLYEVPRAEIGIPSIAYLRHMKASEFVWQAGNPVGNSLVDPRTGLTSTSPILSGQERTHAGWNVNLLGWAAGRASGQGTDYWSRLLREVIYDSPTDGGVENNVAYDLSFEMNYNLWDDYFFSTGTPNQKTRFYQDSVEDPLPNGRVQLLSREEQALDDIREPKDAFHRAATRLALVGGFNVHSTSVEAWKAVLSASRDTGFTSGSGITPYPRLLNPVRGEYGGGNTGAETVYSGFRALTDQEIERLAEEIVVEVRQRAPFLGLADFVNRRLVNDVTGRSGPLEAAIRRAGINAALDSDYPIDNGEDLPSVSFDSMSDTTRLDQRLKPDSVMWGMPGYLTQGDVLQAIGSSLRARSDSFMVRAYGDARDVNGNVLARAWCEATVQRVPEFLDDRGILAVDFGRRFRMVGFRWLNENEV